MRRKQTQKRPILRPRKGSPIYGRSHVSSCCGAVSSASVSEKLEDRRIYPPREKIRYVHEHGCKEGCIVEQVYHGHGSCRLREHCNDFSSPSNLIRKGQGALNSSLESCEIYYRDMNLPCVASAVKPSVTRALRMLRSRSTWTYYFNI